MQLQSRHSEWSRFFSDWRTQTCPRHDNICTCDTGYYQAGASYVPHTARDGNHSTCEVCPTGASCAVDGGQFLVQSKAGFALDPTTQYTAPQFLACGVGHYSALGNDTCTRCPASRPYTVATSLSGQGGASEADCKLCPAGNQFNFTSGSCDACGPGLHASEMHMEYDFSSYSYLQEWLNRPR